MDSEHYTDKSNIIFSHREKILTEQLKSLITNKPKFIQKIQGKKPSKKANLKITEKDIQKKILKEKGVHETGETLLTKKNCVKGPKILLKKIELKMIIGGASFGNDENEDNDFDQCEYNISRRSGRDQKSDNGSLSDFNLKKTKKKKNTKLLSSNTGILKPKSSISANKTGLEQRSMTKKQVKFNRKITILRFNTRKSVKSIGRSRSRSQNSSMNNSISNMKKSKLRPPSPYIRIEDSAERKNQINRKSKMSNFFVSNKSNDIM